MSRQHPRQNVAPNICDGTWKDPETGLEVHCTVEVLVRRPSASGKHFCASKRCQSAKQRAYLKRKREEATSSQRAVTVRLITALATQPRLHCGQCGRDNAISGFYHPTPDGTAACYGTGSEGAALAGTGYLAAAHAV